MDYNEPGVKPMIVLGIDDKKNIHYVNKEASRITGFSDEEIRTQFFKSILPGQEQVIDNALQQSDSCFFQAVLYPKTNASIPASVLLAPSSNGLATYSVFILPELDGLKSSSLLNSVQLIDCPIAILSGDGVIRAWNQSAEQLLGYPASELINKPAASVVVPDRRQEYNLHRRQATDNQEAVSFETALRALDGGAKNLILTFSPIKDHANVVSGLVQVMRDGLDSADQDSANKLAAIVNSSDDAIVSKSLDGIITSWNESAVKMFGYTEKEAKGKHISLIIPTERLKEEIMIIDKIKAGEKVDHFETVRKGKDGSLRNISLTISPIKNKAGQIIGASKIARDIDFKVKAQRQRELYIERLQELNQYKDDFMIMASHELKTPLTVILANLQIIEQITMDEQTKPLLKKVIDKAFQMSSLIAELMDVSKLEAGKLELSKESYRLNDQIAEIVNNLQTTTDKHIIRLLMPEKFDSIIHADKEKMRHVFVNLIENAIKYSPAGGKIDVGYKDDDFSIQVSVTDEGVGISPEDVEHIFQRFYRGKLASSFSGTGIGLFISAEVVKEHQGEISVKSQPGVGTTFTVKIPK